MSKVYQIVTDRITAALEAGTVPWRKTWASAGGLPENLLSHKKYRGVNCFLLSLMPFARPYWLTYKQAQALGGNVRKGEKSTPVVFWTEWEKKNASGEIDKFSVLRYYSAFNVAQCDGLDDKIPPPPEPRHDFTPINRCESIVSGYHGPTLRNGLSFRPCYKPALDVVEMPKPAYFDSSETYYATLFHELGHSTGHKSRLNRASIHDADVHFGSAQYGREELVAEMSAAFLCAESGIDSPTLDNSAAYVASWLKAIKQDVKLVATAAGQAQKAADMILDRFGTKGGAQ